jgi:large subunit ribosomal protein L3
VTISNLKVVKIVPEENLILIKGAVPGAINSIVEMSKSN